jgi:RNA polymerase-binding transcription factor DksA
MERVHFSNPNAAGCLLWYQLHEEREVLCESMLHKDLDSITPIKTQQSCLELMQSRLTRIDNALDRISSGSIGYCSTCGRRLEEDRLDRGAPILECATCEESENESALKPGNTTEGLAISTRQPFEVVPIQTNHSSYRFLLIDPATGRSLVEGGKYFSEPTEATILGCSTRNTAFRSGWVIVGSRLELWAADRLVSTSAIASVQVERSMAEHLLSEVSALHY